MIVGLKIMITHWSSVRGKDWSVTPTSKTSLVELFMLNVLLLYGQVPEGFEMCTRLMLPGEIALVTCPPDYAYDKFPR